MDAMTQTPLTEKANSVGQYALQAHNRLQQAFVFVRQHSGKQAQLFQGSKSDTFSKWQIYYHGGGRL